MFAWKNQCRDLVLRIERNAAAYRGTRLTAADTLLFATILKFSDTKALAESMDKSLREMQREQQGIPDK